jgi:predicted Zn-dependent protease
MLPTAGQAAVAFAQVTSFVDYWTRHAGDDALPKLLRSLRDAPTTVATPASRALEEVSKRSMVDWEKMWRGHIATLPASALAKRPRPPMRTLREAARRERLGQLLLERGHAQAARKQLSRAHGLTPRRSALRALYARALLARGRVDEASDLVAKAADVTSPSADWWSLHDVLGGNEVESRARALAIDPLTEAIACHELPSDELPSHPQARALCLSAIERD